MLRFLLIIPVLMFLASCASQMLESYVGKSITEAELDLGPPVNVVELGADRRGYQWAVTNSDYVPIVTPTTTTYLPYSTDCIYTLLASKRGSDWIVDGFRKPSLECE